MFTETEPYRSGGEWGEMDKIVALSFWAIFSSYASKLPAKAIFYLKFGKEKWSKDFVNGWDIAIRTQCQNY